MLVSKTSNCLGIIHFQINNYKLRVGRKDVVVKTLRIEIKLTFLHLKKKENEKGTIYIHIFGRRR